MRFDGRAALCIRNKLPSKISANRLESLTSRQSLLCNILELARFFVYALTNKSQ